MPLIFSPFSLIAAADFTPAAASDITLPLSMRAIDVVAIAASFYVTILRRCCFLFRLFAMLPLFFIAFRLRLHRCHAAMLLLPYMICHYAEYFARFSRYATMPAFRLIIAAMLAAIRLFFMLCYAFTPYRRLPDDAFRCRRHCCCLRCC